MTSTDFTITQLSNIPDEILEKLVFQTLDEFEILKKIYDNEFISELIKEKNRKNYLLWLLSAKNEFTYKKLENISHGLTNLQKEGSIRHFMDKLRSKTTNTYNNYELEIDFASYYKARGYHVELEPEINADGINPDFRLHYACEEIYFEAKALYFSSILEQEKFDYQIHRDLRRHKNKLGYSIHREPEIKIGEYDKFKKFALKQIEKHIDETEFPIEYNYSDADGKNIAKIVIHGTPNKLEYGYLGGVMDLHASEWNDRNKIIKGITSKNRQLVKGKSNVIILKSSFILTDFESIQDALFGAEKYHISKKTGEITGSSRYGTRVYSSKQNTRISAVIFSKKNWENANFVHKMWVFHNPYAEKPIPFEFFKGENINQFTIVDDNGKNITLDWKNE